MNIIQRKKITIENFGVGVPDIDIEMVLGKRELLEAEAESEE